MNACFESDLPKTHGKEESKGLRSAPISQVAWIEIDGLDCWLAFGIEPLVPFSG